MRLSRKNAIQARKKRSVPSQAGRSLGDGRAQRRHARSGSASRPFRSRIENTGSQHRYREWPPETGVGMHSIGARSPAGHLCGWSRHNRRGREIPRGFHCAESARERRFRAWAKLEAVRGDDSFDREVGEAGLRGAGFRGGSSASDGLAPKPLPACGPVTRLRCLRTIRRRRRGEFAIAGTGRTSVRCCCGHVRLR